MADDKRTRATLPPTPPRGSSHGEDSPPLERARAPRPSLSRQALDAPPALSDRELLLQAIKQGEEKRSAELDEFEEGIKDQIRALVVKELKTSTPPPAATPAKAAPPPQEPYAWLKHVPAILMAVSAIIISFTQSCTKKADLNADVAARLTTVEKGLVTHVTSSDKELLAIRDDLDANYLAELSKHCFMAAVLDKLDVKVDSPQIPGMKCDPIDFNPPPLKKSGDAHRIQPKATFAWPAKP